MKNLKIKTNFSILALAIILFSACQKEELPPKKTILPPIKLECNAFTENDMVLKNDTNRPIDYYVSCVMDIHKNISIEPGTVIQFADDAGFAIDESSISGIGSLKAIGTEEKPIELVAENNKKGAWKGLYFNTPKTTNQLKHVKIDNAGGSAFNSNNDLGSIVLWADAKLSMKNIVISNSASYGFNANYTNSVFSLNNSTISTCEKAPILITQSYIGEINNSNQFTNNKKSYIRVEVNTDAIEKDISISKLNIPYRIFSYNNGFQHLLIKKGTTQITEDVTIEFEDGTGIYVDDDGTLKVNSSGERVLFTGVEKQANAWKGIYFQFTQGFNSLKNLTIEYAGNTYDGNNSAIGMWGDPRVAVSNIEFKHINGCAFTDYNNTASSPNPNFSQSNNTFTSVSQQVCYN